MTYRIIVLNGKVRHGATRSAVGGGSGEEVHHVLDLDIIRHGEPQRLFDDGRIGAACQAKPTRQWSATAPVFGGVNLHGCDLGVRCRRVVVNLLDGLVTFTATSAHNLLG